MKDELKQFFGRFTGPERAAVIFLVVTFLIGSGVSYFKSRRAQELDFSLELEAASRIFRELSAVQPSGGQGEGASRESVIAAVDLNTASQQDLERLPRIGPKMAQRILSYREEHGGFGSVEELKRIKGIGDKTYKEIKPYIVLKSGGGDAQD